jgi:hypothetical protein
MKMPFPAVLALFGVVLAILLAVVLVRARAQGHASRPVRPSTARLRAHLDTGRTYQVFVDSQSGAAGGWVRVETRRDETLLLEDGSSIALDAVRRFVVAYPSGELLDADPSSDNLPPGVHSMKAADVTVSAVLREEEMARGRALVRVTYGPDAARPRNPHHYATTLTNVSKEKVRILRFGGFVLEPDGAWRLNNIGRGFYTAEQFREWYGVRGDGWILPGETATDPNNYGSRPARWAYYGETASGEAFVTGGVHE